MLLTGDLDEQVDEAVALLRSNGSMTPTHDSRGALTERVPASRGVAGPHVAVLDEPGQPRTTRELLGVAAQLAAGARGHVALFTTHPSADLHTLAAWGADRAVAVANARVEEVFAAALTERACVDPPWAILAPGTIWGREVAGRTAAAIGAGLVGDAVDLNAADGRLIAWKPAFGGHVVAAITVTSPVQIATVRPGIFPLRTARFGGTIPISSHSGRASRVHVTGEERDDEVGALQAAGTVIGLGNGVNEADLPLLEPLRLALGAQFGASRKVTDRGWMPHARQVGITGQAIAPRLYICVGISGKFNHMVGVRGAHTIVAINNDPDAPVFTAADIGILGDWRQVTPILTKAVSPAGSPTA